MKNQDLVSRIEGLVRWARPPSVILEPTVPATDVSLLALVAVLEQIEKHLAVIAYGVNPEGRTN